MHCMALHQGVGALSVCKVQFSLTYCARHSLLGGLLCIKELYIQCDRTTVYIFVAFHGVSLNSLFDQMVKVSASAIPLK